MKVKVWWLVQGDSHTAVTNNLHPCNAFTEIRNDVEMFEPTGGYSMVGLG